MRFELGTFSSRAGQPFAGLVLRDKVVALTGLESTTAYLGTRLTGTASVLDLLENWPANFNALQQIVAALSADSNQVHFTPVDQLHVYPPVYMPRQILCSGANYKKHVVDLIVDQGGGPETAGMSAAERRTFATALMDKRAREGAPYIFGKLPSAVVGPFDDILLPPNTKQPDWELELAVVIGRPARRVSRADASSYIAGYTIANDLTNRDLVFRQDMKAIGTDWVASKNSPRCTPIGPYLVPAAFVGDTQNLQIQLKLNGETKQDESTSDMIFDVPRLIEYTSSLIQLLPGDVLLTGSPAGNGSHFNRFLRPGDVMEASITGLGQQRNRCIAEEA